MNDEIETSRLIGLSGKNTTTKSKVHLIPCKIKYEGPAKVKDYFETTIEKRTFSRNFSKISLSQILNLCDYFSNVI